MSTDIDDSLVNELIARLKSVDATSAHTSSEAAEVLRSQQKRIEELETTLAIEQFTNDCAMLQLAAIQQAVAKLKAGGSTSDFFAALYELDAVKVAPAQQPENRKCVFCNWSGTLEYLTVTPEGEFLCPKCHDRTVQQPEQGSEK